MSKRQEVTSISNDTQKREPLCNVGESVNWRSQYGNNMDVPRKTKNRTTRHVGVLCRFSLSDSATPRTVAHKTPLSMGFSRQEYWSGLPCPPPGDPPDPGMEPRSPALQADSLPSEVHA